MPPKRAKSTKKQEEDASAHSESEAPVAKKAKKSRQPADVPAQPTNTTLPETVTFPEKAAGAIRLSTWNIAGLAASQKKGFNKYVEAEDPDILVLTETKVNKEPEDVLLSKLFPYRYWSISDTKTYGGTAVLSKHKPLSIDMALPNHPKASEVVKGRLITVEFENHYVIGAYVPNSGQKLKSLDTRKEWNEHFAPFIRELDSKKPVIWTGDMNVAPTEKDLTNPKPNWNKTPGYTEVETSAFREILSPEDGNKFVDVWRQRHAENKHYTYFGYRFNCRAKGIGWRLDHFVVSERILEHVKMCEIRDEIYGASDHCPVTLELEGDL